MKTRASIAASILDNPEILEEVYAQASDAAGSAEEELAKYMESTQGKLNQFNNAVQEVWATTLNSEVINFFIDLGTAAAEAVTKMGGLVPVVGGLLTGMASLTKNVGLFGTRTDALTGNNIGLTFGGVDLKNISQVFSGKVQPSSVFDSNAIDEYNRLAEVLPVINKESQEYASTQAAMNEVLLQTDTRTAGLIKSANGAVVSTDMQAKAAEGYGLKAQAASIATRALSVTLNMLVGLAIGAVFTKAADALYNFTHQLENAKRAAQDAANNYSELQSKVESLQNELKTTGQRIDELNNKQNLTLVEEDELEQLRQTNAQLEHELEIRTALADLAKEEADQSARDYLNTTGAYQGTATDISGNFISQTYSGNQVDIFKGQIETYKTYSKQLDKWEQELADISAGRIEGIDTESLTYQRIQEHYDELKTEFEDLGKEIRSTAGDLLDFENQLSDDNEISISLKVNIDEALDDFYDEFTGEGNRITKIIEEAFARPTLEGAKEELIDLAKRGATVTAETLEEILGKALTELNGQGVSNDQIMQYVSSIARPDEVNVENLRNSIYQGIHQNQLTIQPELDTTEADREFDAWFKEISKSKRKLNIIYTIQASNDTDSWSLEDWMKAYDDMVEAAKQGIEVDITVIDSVSDLKGVIDNIQKVGDVYEEFKDTTSKDFSVAGLEGVVSAFKDISAMEQPLASFLNILTDGESTIEQQQQAFNDLIYSYLEATGTLKELEGANGAYIESQLKAAGIEVQHQEAISAVTQAKIDEATADWTVADVTAESIQQLADEIGVTDQAREAFYAYCMQKLSDTVFSTESDIDQLSRVVSALGIATSAWTKYYAARAQMEAAVAAGPSNYNGAGPEPGDYVSYEDNIAALGKNAERLLKEAEASITSVKAAPVGTGSSTKGGSGGGGGGGGDGGGSESEPSESEFDLISRRLEILDKQREDLLNRGESSYLSYFGLSEDEIDRAVEILNNADAATADSLEELAIMAQNAGMSLQDFFEAMSSVGDYSSRESNLYMAMQIDVEGINLGQQAVDQYDQIAEEALSKLSEEQQEWVKKGDMQVLTLIGDEADAFQEALDAWDQRQDAIDDLNQRYVNYLEDVQGYYDLQNDALDQEIDRLEKRNSLIQTSVSLAQSTGEIVQPGMYEAMISNSQAEENKYKKEIKNRQEELEKLIDPLSGNILDTEVYKQIQDEILDLEANLAQCAVDQADWNYEITQIPINLMQQATDLYQQMITQIQNWGAEEEAAGRKLDSNYYQTLIDNGLEVIDQLQRQKDLLEDVLDETDYATGSDRWNEVYSALQDVNSEISSMVQNLYEWNKALLEMPLESISTASSELEMVRDALQNVQDDYDTVISAVTTAIGNYRDDLEKQQEEETDALQQDLDYANERLTLLEQENEELKLQTALEQAEYELARAATQKTQRVDVARTYSNVRALKCA